MSATVIPLRPAATPAAVLRVWAVRIKHPDGSVHEITHVGGDAVDAALVGLDMGVPGSKVDVQQVHDCGEWISQDVPR